MPAWRAAAGVEMSCGGGQVRCQSFNGEEVRNLARLAELVDGCTDKYMKFGLEGGKLVILERVQAIADAPRILQQHAIPFDRSADLRHGRILSPTLLTHDFSVMISPPLVDSGFVSQLLRIFLIRERN